MRSFYVASGDNDIIVVTCKQVNNPRSEDEKNDRLMMRPMTYVRSGTTG